MSTDPRPGDFTVTDDTLDKARDQTPVEYAVLVFLLSCQLADKWHTIPFNSLVATEKARLLRRQGSLSPADANRIRGSLYSGFITLARQERICIRLLLDGTFAVALAVR